MRFYPSLLFCYKTIDDNDWTTEGIFYSIPAIIKTAYLFFRFSPQLRVRLNHDDGWWWDWRMIIIVLFPSDIHMEEYNNKKVICRYVTHTNCVQNTNNEQTYSVPSAAPSLQTFWWARNLIFYCLFSRRSVMNDWILYGRGNGKLLLVLEILELQCRTVFQWKWWA